MSVVSAQQEKEGLVKHRYIERRILEKNKNKNTKDKKNLSMLSLCCCQVLWFWTGARDLKNLLKGNKNET